MKSKTQNLLIFLGGALAFSGCVLESPFLSTKCPDSDEEGTLAYIWTNEGICKAEDCLNADNCCGIADKSERTLVWESFKYSRCPVESKFPQCQNDGKKYFCSPGCLAGYELCKGECVNFQSTHIKSCQNNQIVCDEGYLDCDENSLNGCELAPSAHVKSCTHGEMQCIPGYGACDNDDSNGCETNIKNDPNHCGECHASCDSMCSNGECRTSCSAGERICNGKCISMSDAHFETCDDSSDGFTCKDDYFDCDQAYETGCEVNLKSDKQNCGRCGVSCKEEDQCVDGECIANRCSEPTPKLCVTQNNETECRNVMGNNENECGDCDYRCADHPKPNASSTSCFEGQCLYDCAPGLINIGEDRTYQNIACIDPNTDSEHCGAGADSPGEVCLSEQVCLDGHCVDNSCTAPMMLCSTSEGGKCFDVMGSDNSHCGKCNYNCSKHPMLNAQSNVCQDGECQYECSEGYLNVGIGASFDYIECINPESDSRFCGAQSASDKGIACDSNEICFKGECIVNSCNGTLQLCSVLGENRCIDIYGDDPDHCGGCNDRCSEKSMTNAVSNTCKSGTCQYECTSGFVNVGTGKTMQTIHCIDPLSDKEHCGASDSDAGDSCDSDEICDSGQCVVNNCGSKARCLISGKYQCIDVHADDINNCGNCNNRCVDFAPSGTSVKACDSGTCTFSCPSGLVNVGIGITTSTIRCINPQNDNDYCGAAGNPNGGATSSQVGKRCSSDENCVDAVCTKKGCSDESLTKCLTPSGIVCVDLRFDSEHCGGCNSACSAQVPSGAKSDNCSNGTCQYTCMTGLKNCGTGTTYSSILCADVKTDSNHCGVCGKKCKSGEACVNGTCEQFPILTYLLDKGMNEDRCDNVSHYCSEINNFNTVCTDPNNSSCFSFENNTHFECGNESYAGIYFDIYSVYEASNGLITFYEHSRYTSKEALNKLTSVSCSTDITKYKETELTIGDNSCSFSPIICSYNKKTKKIYKFTVVMSNEDKMMYWMPDN